MSLDMTLKRDKTEGEDEIYIHRLETLERGFYVYFHNLILSTKKNIENVRENQHIKVDGKCVLLSRKEINWKSRFLLIKQT